MTTTPANRQLAPDRSPVKGDLLLENFNQLKDWEKDVITRRQINFAIETDVRIIVQMQDAIRRYEVSLNYISDLSSDLSEHAGSYFQRMRFLKGIMQQLVSEPPPDHAPMTNAEVSQALAISGRQKAQNITEDVKGKVGQASGWLKKQFKAYSNAEKSGSPRGSSRPDGDSVGTRSNIPNTPSGSSAVDPNRNTVHVIGSPRQCDVLGEDDSTPIQITEPSFYLRSGSSLLDTSAAMPPLSHMERGGGEDSLISPLTHLQAQQGAHFRGLGKRVVDQVKDMQDEDDMIGGENMIGGEMPLFSSNFSNTENLTSKAKDLFGNAVEDFHGSGSSQPSRPSVSAGLDSPELRPALAGPLPPPPPPPPAGRPMVPPVSFLLAGADEVSPHAAVALQGTYPVIPKAENTQFSSATSSINTLLVDESLATGSGFGSAHAHASAAAEVKSQQPRPASPRNPLAVANEDAVPLPSGSPRNPFPEPAEPAADIPALQESPRNPFSATDQEGGRVAEKNEKDSLEDFFNQLEKK